MDDNLSAVTFAAEDSYQLAGRGKVYTGPWPFTCDRRDAAFRLVSVGGEIYRVAGIEWFAVPREPRLGDKVGLLLEPCFSAQ